MGFLRNFVWGWRVSPLLRELYPDKTDKESGELIQLFGYEHGGVEAGSLERSHIDELFRTLNFWVGVRREAFRPGGTTFDSDSPNLTATDCEACQRFNAWMLQNWTGEAVTEEELIKMRRRKQMEDDE